MCSRQEQKPLFPVKLQSISNQDPSETSFIYGTAKVSLHTLDPLLIPSRQEARERNKGNDNYNGSFRGGRGEEHCLLRKPFYMVTFFKHCSLRKALSDNKERKITKDKR